MRRSLFFFLLMAFTLGFQTTGPFGGGSRGLLTAYTAPEPAGFVLMSASDLSGIETTRVPPVYYSESPSDTLPSPVATSSWTGYDVTCEAGTGCTPASGTSAFPSVWSCAEMVGNGVANDGPAFQCLFAALSSQEYLYIPDGTGDYVLDSFTTPDIFIQPDSTDDQQGIICESRNAVLSSRGGNDDIATEDQMRIIRTDANEIVTDHINTDVEPPVQNSTWTLTGDFSEGEIGSFTTNTTHTLVTGDWVTITSERTGEQQSDDQMWTSIVASTPSGTTFTIEHPLPNDFGNSAIGATEWDPLEEFVIRDCTLEHEDGTHLLRGKDDLITLFGCANCEISGNALYRGYQHFMVIENSSNIWIEGNDAFDPTWDKGPNGYGLRLSGTSRLVAHNNAIQHVQPVAVGSSTKSILLMFNSLLSPDRGCTDIYDSPTGGTGSGAQTSGTGADGYCDSDGETYTYDMDCTNNGNVCQRPALALHNIHTAEVGTTGYMHCSGNEDDASGGPGAGNSGGCNGTPATGSYGCIEWHNGAGSQGLAMRNHCEASSVWIDFFEGPGRDNFNFGNWVGADSGHDNIPFSRGKGDFAIVTGTGSSTPTAYRRNSTWSNNIFEGDVARFDDASNGVYFSDNVISGSCQYTTCIDTNEDGTCDADGVTPQLTDPTGGDCTGDGSELTSSSLGMLPTTRTWTQNTVGANEHPGGYTRTMPSLPGFSDWPSFDGDDSGLTPPFVGPEVGDPTSYTGNEGCLPAFKRWNGGSC